MVRLRFLLLFCLTGALCACSNSADVNVTAPTVTRCAVSAGVSSTVVPAGGGTGTLTINTERECSWSATAEAAWITLSSSRGQGPASVSYSVAANPDTSMRRAAVAVEQQRVEIAQEAAPCRYAVSPAALAFPAAGGSVEVTITTSANCRWTVQGSPAWALPDRAEGAGTTTISFNAAANAGSTRTASVLVAGVDVTLTQTASSAPPCSYEVSPTSVSLPAEGGQSLVNVAAAAACAWTATTNASWVSIAEGSAGVGNGTVRLGIGPNDGPARSSAAVIAGRTVTVAQAGREACSYALKPTYYNAGRGPDEFSIAVTAPAGCQWTASSPVDWATIQSGQSGAGSGTVIVRVKPNNDGGARNATLTIAGQRFTLTQEGR